MDKDLKRQLDKQDWEGIVEELTLHALHWMRLCGYKADKAGSIVNATGMAPGDYAMEAVEKVYAAVTTGTNKWDSSRGDLLPFMKQVVKQLVTNDRRTKIPGEVLMLEDWMVFEPLDVDEAKAILNRALDMAEGDLKEFIFEVWDQAQGGKINWTSVKEKVKLNNYRLNQMRAELERILEACGAAEWAKT